VLSTSCTKDDPSDNNHGFGFDVDAVDSTTGISVKYNEADTFQFPIELIVETYHITENCLGLYSDKGPPVIITNNSNNLIINGVQFSGYFYHSPPLVVVHDGLLSMNDTFRLEHEFIHYLLQANGQNPNHTEENQILFDRCSI